jgi:protoheme IX farnesyltransferase
MAAAVRQRVLDYVETTKPRISLMALATVAVGSFIASAGSLDVVLLVHTLAGTALLASGASVLNQVLERDTDALMYRTRNRPLPTGRLSVTEATVFGFLASVAGLNYLCVLVNPLTGLIGAITLGLYVFLYTPLKRHTSLNTVIGAIPGALPPVMGWVAVRGSIDVAAWILFAIVFLWQFPHFLAIAWMYREDYARAGLKMLPVLDREGGMTARQMIGYSLALVPASMAPSVMRLTNQAYFFGALLLGLAFLAFSIAFALAPATDRARNVLRASLVYLPTLFAFMVFSLS